MSLNYGLVGLDWQDCSLEELFRRARDLGAPRLELFNRDNYHGAEIDRVPELSDRYGVTVELVSCRAKLNTDPTEGAPWVLESIRHAAVAGARYSAFMFGGNPDLGRREALDRFVELLRPLAEAAARAGVTLLVENVFSRLPHDITATAEGCAELVERVGRDHFGIHFDPCNLMIGGEEAFPYGYDLVMPYVRTLHLKDAVRYSPALYPMAPDRPMVDHARGTFLSTPHGQGAMNMAGLVKRLQRDHFSGPVLLELFCGPGRRDRYWGESCDWLAQHSGRPGGDGADE